MRITSGLVLQALPALLTITSALAGDVKVHSSGRYYQDASGKPLFLIGYYAWSAVPDGYYIDHPSRYAEMMTHEQQHHLNYIRISLGVNRMGPGGHPPSWNRVPTPVPFLYVKSGGQYKADLDQWDPAFWDGLKKQCALAKRTGFIIHVSIFDGVELRRQGGADFGYANSFWNPSRQTRWFYPDPDINHNGQIDEDSEFYKTSEFEAASTPGTLSYYQKRLIEKTATELKDCNNVFFEIGNETLGSSASWNSAVLRFIKSRTNKVVTECNNNSERNRGVGLQGWSQHNANTAAEVKANVASIVGHGWPAWEDPDGTALSNAGALPDERRRAAWYAFVGGAACWGGFSSDWWRDSGPGWSTTTATYYKNLLLFINETQLAFGNMTPQHALTSNPSVNSCLAQRGKAYLAYILNDASATLDLSALVGDAHYKIYDPQASTWTGQQTVSGGDTRPFTKPTNADDWVIYVYK